MPAGALDAALSAAEQESLSYLEFLHRLLAGPAEAKRQRALERRIRAAQFREVTTLEGFDWEFNAKGWIGGSSSSWPRATSCAGVRT